VADAGFRLNGEPAVRLPMRLGDEAHWLRVARHRNSITVGLAGHDHTVMLAPAAGGRLVGQVDGRDLEARVDRDEDATVVRRHCLRFEFRPDTGAEHHASAEHEGHVRAPMPGHVLDVRAAAGSEVAAGAVLVVLEAMKMEHSLVAPWAGAVKSVAVKPGDRVEEGAELVVLEPREAASPRQPAAPD